MTRAEHLAWAKQRALEYLRDDLPLGGVVEAMASFASDLHKHPETFTVDAPHDMAELIMQHGMEHLTPAKAREMIEGAT